MTLAPARPTERPAAAATDQRIEWAADRVGEQTLGGNSAWSCLVCAGPAPQPEGCCSEACARLAHHELQDSSRHLRSRADDLADDLTNDRAGAEHRRHLAERAGRLSSALLRWRAAGDPTRCPGLVAPRNPRATPGALPHRVSTNRRAAEANGS